MVEVALDSMSFSAFVVGSVMLRQDFSSSRPYGTNRLNKNNMHLCEFWRSSWGWLGVCTLFRNCSADKHQAKHFEECHVDVDCSPINTHCRLSLLIAAAIIYHNSKFSEVREMPRAGLISPRGNRTDLDLIPDFYCQVCHTCTFLPLLTLFLAISSIAIWGRTPVL